MCDEFEKKMLIDDTNKDLQFSMNQDSMFENLNDDLNNVFDIQIDFDIYFIIFNMKIQTYEQIINEKTKAELIDEENIAFVEARNENDEKRDFFSFNNSTDYDLNLSFQKIDCIKNDVINFFKNDFLKSFLADIKQQKQFFDDLSFNNEEK